MTTTKVKLTAAQGKRVKAFTTMAGKIRYLNSLGHTQGDISRYLTTPAKLVRPQWVNGVLRTPVKTPKEPIK